MGIVHLRNEKSRNYIKKNNYIKIGVQGAKQNCTYGPPNSVLKYKEIIHLKSHVRYMSKIVSYRPICKCNLKFSIHKNKILKR